jgi:hypothetical protein
MWLSSLEHLRMRHSDVEHVGWVDATPGHEHRLLTCAREVFDDPTVQLTIFSFKSFC